MTVKNLINIPMIERLQKFAKVLSRIRYFLLLLAGFCAGLTLLSLIDNPWFVDDRWLLHSFISFLWLLMLYALSQIFLRLPPPVESAENWREHLSFRIRRGMMWLLGVLFLSLSLLLVLLSYQLLRVALMSASTGNMAS